MVVQLAEPLEDSTVGLKELHSGEHSVVRLELKKVDWSGYSSVGMMVDLTVEKWGDSWVEMSVLPKGDYLV